MMKYDKNISKYPDKILADKALSRMSRFENGEIGRTRTYDIGLKSEYTLYTLSGYGNIAGQRFSDGSFVPFKNSERQRLMKYRRKSIPSKGMMRRAWTEKSR